MTAHGARKGLIRGPPDTGPQGSVWPPIAVRSHAAARALASTSYLCELCIAARARRGRGLGAVGGGALTLTPGLFSVLSLAVKLVYMQHLIPRDFMGGACQI